MKRALPLLLLLASAALLAWLALGGGRDTTAGGRASVATPGEPAPPAGDAGPAALEAPDATKLEAERRSVAAAEPASAIEAPQAPARALRRLDVRVAAPSGTPADEVVEVIVLDHELGHGRVVAAIDAGIESDSDTDELGAPAIFADLVPADERPSFIRAAIVARGIAERDADGGYRVTLEVPAEDPLFAHVAGTHLRTPRAKPVTEKAFASGLELAPELGAAIDVVATSGEGAQAVEGVRLALGKADGGPPDFSGANPQPEGGSGRRAKTDAGGRVRFRALPTGFALEVKARPGAHAPEEASVPALEPGETRLVEIELAAGATLAGTVTDPEGRPISGARVSVARRGQAFGFDDEVLRKGDAEADGTFLLRGLASGKLIVRADHDAWLESKPETIELRESESLRGVVLALREGRSIRGTARFADGVPAAGIEVSATFDMGHMAGPAALGMLQGHSSRATTDPKGEFELRGLGSGPFAIVAGAVHPNDRGAASAVEPWRARLDGITPRPEPIVLTLHPGLAIAGRVVDDLGAPVGGVTVRAVRVTDGALGSFDQQSTEAKADARTGAFALPNLVAGDWELLVAGPTHLTLEPHEVSLPEAAGVDVVLVAHRAASVAGTVRAPGGIVVGGAKVSVRSGDPEWQEAFRKRGEPSSTRSNDDGTFELAGVPPREVALFAASDEWALSADVRLTLAPGEARRGIELVLTSGGSISGEVYDAEGRPAAGRLITIQGASLAEARTPTSSDANGEFLVEHLTPGRYQVVAVDLRTMGEKGSDDEGGIDVAGLMSSLNMASADVVEGEVVHVVLGAPPADPVRVSGTVTQKGEPCTGALISFFPAGPKLYEGLKTAEVADDGAYSLVLDEPGDYIVAVQRVGESMAEQSTVEFSAKVPKGEEHREDFAMPGGRISGRVVDAKGKPVAKARISLSSDEGVRTDLLMGGNTAEMSTRSDGTFEFDSLRPGTYRVAAGGALPFGGASASHGRVVRGGLQLGDDDWLSGVELRVPDPGELEVTVRAADGTAKSGATVFVRDAEGRFLEAFSMLATGPAGTVKIEGLAPGRYTLSAQADALAAADGAPVEVRAGETSAATVQLEQGTQLRVRLERRGEGEVPSASLRVLDSGGRDVTGMVSLAAMQGLSPDDAFSRTEHRLGPLAPGRYTVIARAGTVTGERRVTLRGEAERSVTVVLD